MLFKIVRFLISCFVHVVFRLKVSGKENFPKTGGAVIAINHRSYWDVPVCASVLPRKLFFMGKQELFDKPFLGAIIKWAGAFPVARGTADIGAIKTALGVLKEEKCMAIFPEGRRVKENEEHEVKLGAALIASKAGVPVVPVCISGKYIFLNKVNVHIGKPIYIEGADGKKPTKEELMSFSKQILDGVLKGAID